MATKTTKKSKTKVDIKPLGDHVLIERVEAETKTAGGIVLPESAKEKPREGVVIAVGDGRLGDDGKRNDLQVAKGDRVIFSSYAGTEIKHGGHEYLIVREDEILAVVA